MTCECLHKLTTATLVHLRSSHRVPASPSQMPRALSSDLCWVIVEKRIFFGETLQKIANDTLQSLTTVQ